MKHGGGIMILYNKNNYFKSMGKETFDFDYVFTDIYNNVNFIKHTYNTRLKKDIKSLFETNEITTIHKLNMLLNDMKLAIVYIDGNKRTFLYEIISLKEYEKQYKIKLNTNEHLFDDLD